MFKKSGCLHKNPVSVGINLEKRGPWANRGKKILTNVIIYNLQKYQDVCLSLYLAKDLAYH